MKKIILMMALLVIMSFAVSAEYSNWTHDFITCGAFVNDGGMRIYINTTGNNLLLNNVSVDSGSSFTNVSIYDSSRSTKLNSTNVKVGNNFTLHYVLESKETYWIIGLGGNNHCYDGIGTSYPKTHNNITWNLGLNPTTGSTDLLNGGYDILGIGYEVIPLPYNYTLFYNATSIETLTERYILEMVHSKNSIESATFNFNGTNYTTSITGTFPKYNISTTIDLGFNSGTKKGIWYIDLNGTAANITINTLSQIINPFTIGQCNSTLTSNWLNITFKNETATMENTNATLTGSITYYISDVNKNKTFIYNNNTENNLYKFCGIQPSYTLNTIVNFNYGNSESPQRSLKKNYVLSNSSTKVLLYLLPLSKGQYVSFQVLSIAEQPINDAQINVTHATYGSIASGRTDSSGIFTVFLNPLESYTVSASSSGYGLATETIVPSQTSYTITLGSTASAATDYLKGMSTIIKPEIFVNLLNDTVYNFNMTLSSSYWTVSNWGFVLYDDTNQIIAQKSAAAAGIVSENINTYSNSTISINYYWVIDGNYTNVTAYWNVRTTGDTSNSLFAFITDLKNYINSGMFGIDNFGLGLVLFFLVFLTGGYAAREFGYANPSVIIAAMAGMIVLLDFGLGIIPNPIGVPYFPSIFAVLFTLAFVIREAQR